MTSNQEEYEYLFRKAVDASLQSSERAKAAMRNAVPSDVVVASSPALESKKKAKADRPVD